MAADRVLTGIRRHYFIHLDRAGRNIPGQDIDEGVAFRGQVRIPALLAGSTPSGLAGR